MDDGAYIQRGRPCPKRPRSSLPLKAVTFIRLPLQRALEPDRPAWGLALRLSAHLNDYVALPRHL